MFFVKHSTNIFYLLTIVHEKYISNETYVSHNITKHKCSNKKQNR